MRNKGFTLIELMIVVAIIAIIAAIAIPNLLRSRMAAHETAAAASCKAFAEAEDIYRRTDYNKDGVLEYATALKGANSLYETTADQADVGLIDRTFAQAEGAPDTASPKAGYVFTVLTEQGPAATGGNRPYLSNSGGGTQHMTLGYALSAVPAQYDGTGRNTFMISNAGTIYQQDKGNTDTLHETFFNPDQNRTLELLGWLGLLRPG
jgi:prepilin-type N-terminal cleavage/methylation domain-containing protein